MCSKVLHRLQRVAEGYGLLEVTYRVMRAT